jgi:hypothetical protein
MRLVLTLVLMLLPAVAFAQSAPVNLLLAPALETPDAPFYRGARVKIGNEILPVQETELPAGTLAEYNPDLNSILISTTESASETAKAQALMDILSALEAGAIQTAAGRE